MLDLEGVEEAEGVGADHLVHGEEGAVAGDGFGGVVHFEEEEVVGFGLGVVDLEVFDVVGVLHFFDCELLLFKLLLEFYVSLLVFLSYESIAC